MKKNCTYSIVLLLFCFFTLSISGQTTLINNGSSWSYYDNGNEPTVQGSFDWNDSGFDASSWSNGNAHLGYGDGDEATVINSSTLTAYVRHSFNITNPSNYDSLNLNLTFDDGAIVYLNGVEVWRINMPGGAVSYSTFSSAVGTENGTASSTIVTSLVAGTNVIAVEIHQASAGSSDISFDFELEGNAPGQVNVNRGPYLQKGTPTSMVVRWRTATPTETVIDYGTSLGALNQNFTNNTLKTEHIVELTGLTSSTVYYYQISNASAVLVPESTDMYFKTHPTVGSTQSYTFWALGDPGTANNDQRAVRDAYYNYIGSNVTDGILFLGDNAYNDGTDNEYQNAVFQNMYEDKLKNSVAWSTLGNHDGHSADSNSQTGPYYDIFTFPTAGESGGMPSGTEAYYSFDYGNIHFIVLESYETDRSVGGAMYNWAQSDIQNTTQEWIVAIWHHPPYTKGSHNSDTETQLVEMRQNFLPMLESNGVDLTLSGHSHSYERSYFLNGHYGTSGTFNSGTMTVGASGSGDGKVDGNGAYVKGASAPEGAVYITAGSSGKISGGNLNHNAMFASLNQLGSCILEVSGSTLNLKFITNTGAITDYFTIQKGCTQGASCDDGDPCTVNDVFDANCDCAGTPDTSDEDGDGVCDSADQEANSPCPLNVDSNGVSIDTDNDGVADCLDQEVNSPCPNNVDTNGVSLDTDGDGVCDDNDVCPGGNDNADADGDGIPDFCDSFNCIPDAASFGSSPLTHSGSGASTSSANILTDGQDVTFTVSGLNQRTNGKTSRRYIEEVTITYVDEGGSALTYGTFNAGSSSSVNVNISGIVQSVTVSLADAYDGNSSTQLSVNLSTVNFCVETVQCNDSDGDGVCDPDDQCPGFDDNVDTDGDGTPDGCDTCNDLVDTDADGVSDCVDQEINSPCPNTVDANGVSLDTDSDGVCDDLDQCPGSDDSIDSDNDGIPDGCDSCDNNLIGIPCNDGDACTENDVYDADCNCIGTLTQDTDGDGVCDAEDQEINSPCPNTVDANGVTLDSDNDGVCDDLDQCPGQDDALIGTSCDDGNACTTNDVYDANCGCAGTPAADNDGDGYCSVEDPNDNDPCIPDAGAPGCSNCGDIISDGFESNFGNWNDGGNDVARSTSNANTGIYSVRLRDNSGSSSSMFTDNLDLSGETEVMFEFSFYAKSMETGENFFLEVSTNGGSSYSVYQNWIRGTDFNNNTRYNESINVTWSFTSNTRFRLRCDASHNNDQVYIDDVVITDCITSALVKAATSKTTNISSTSTANLIKVYPNPTSQTLFVRFNQVNDVKVNATLYNVAGQSVLNVDIKGNTNEAQKINLDGLSDGLYILRMLNDKGNVLKTERIIIKNK